MKSEGAHKSVIIAVSLCFFLSVLFAHESLRRWYAFWVGVLKPVKAKIRGSKWNANHIVDDIFLGDVEDAYNVQVMRDELKVTHVISCVMGLRYVVTLLVVFVFLLSRVAPRARVQGLSSNRVPVPVPSAARHSGRVYRVALSGRH